ncbi:hypothetical protein MTER_04260 [Mycolicibacter terrae]|uniref:ESX-1 secretion-associated protein n=1 Tax=Mycolicibacter terrae TaxID=1788 RepID=A0AAD1HUP8_9MYCO|nr:hypothetical protein [Mycolicibacter terrae]BBX21015.1 hypothetical protein MTER_04260 [Mycolicibacter terrae]
MTEAPLQANPAGLVAVAARCQALAAGFALAPPAGVASNWQASARAVNTSTGRASRAAAASAERMRATGTKLTAAADRYEANEADAAQRFSQLSPRGPVLT